MPVAQVLQAIDMLCEDKAAVFLDSSYQLKDALNRGEASTATLPNLDLLEKALRDRFLACLVDDSADQQLYNKIKDLRQGSGESFAAYYSRA